MATKRLPRPRDPLALGKLIGDIGVDVVEDGKNETAKRSGLVRSFIQYGRWPRLFSIIALENRRAMYRLRNSHTYAREDTRF
jgi:hypothetical protein